MATKIRKNTDAKKLIRFKRKRRIRADVNGVESKPRLAVFKSNKHIYAQLINDETGMTIVSASTAEEANRKDKLCANLKSAKTIGTLIAERAKQKKVEKVVFDRSGYLYHGKIKVLADAAREAGLKF